MSKINYRGVSIPQHLAAVIQYMTTVDLYREQLLLLGQRWDLLTILASMNGDNSDMGSTREGFEKLTDALITELAEENLSKVVGGLSAISQVIVDIVIRNLFERTADIGFLATDDDIRRFLIARKEDKSSDDEIASIVERFQEYVAKYSVYDNIILLTPDGKVAAQLDEESEVDFSNDPIIKEAATTSQEYIEVYRYSDLVPAKDKALIYAYKVTSHNNPMEILGILCLSFRFQDELEGIFSDLCTSDLHTGLLLDSEGRVIASSDITHVPVGTKMKVVLDKAYDIVSYGGRSYLAKTCKTKGYQGFMGLGWLGHVLTPIDRAFNTADFGVEIKREPELSSALSQNTVLFSKKIKEIPEEAKRIQRELDRTVWNGNIAQRRKDKQFVHASRVLLFHISKTGSDTKGVFESSIRELQETVLTSLMQDLSFHASLAIDIMDRNLYERANDCRWWALTAAFRSILGKEIVDEKDRQTITEILKYINGLYTVYTNLFVFTKQKKVIAVSNPEEQALVGTTLHQSWVEKTLAIRSSQEYVVSDFESTDLYGNKSTYVYCAAIKDIDDQNKVVGGIGIVFDSTPQFEEIIKDSLPVDDKGLPLQGSFGVLCDAQGKVLSSTSKQFKIGEIAPLPDDIPQVASGEKASSILEIEGDYYVVGVGVSAGYREYKKTDSYKNEVTSYILIPIGRKVACRTELVSQDDVMDFDSSPSTAENIACEEIGTFFVSNAWVGFRMSEIVSAIEFRGVTRIPNSSPNIAGIIRHDDVTLPVLLPHCLFTTGSNQSNEGKEVIIVKTSMGMMGVLVDRLGSVLQVSENEIQRDSNLMEIGDGSIIEGLYRPKNAGKQKNLLLILEVSKLSERLIGSDTYDSLTLPSTDIISLS